jgi:hypothetical protein
MTPSYIYESMTWAEIDAAIDYASRFDMTERYFKGSKNLNDWLYKGRDMLPTMMRKMIDSIRGKGGA